MRILITGGSGFIGSHLAERLLTDGHQVVALDDLSTGRERNVAHLLDRPGFELRRGSIFDGSLLAQAVAEVDLIFHLAAAVGVQLIVDNPVHTIETNVRGTELVLEHALSRKVRLLIASTSEVYGKSEEPTFREDSDLVLGPSTKSRWAYAASKLLDEFLGLGYHRQFGLPVVILRLFNTVGPRQTGQYGMVVPRFVGQALRDEPITVYGDGLQTRTFTHVADAVGAMVDLAFHPRAAGEVFNIGGDEEISILELARRVKSVLRSASEIRRIPYDEVFGSGFEDMMRRVPDIGKVGSWTGYEPRRTVEDIIRDVAEYERTRPSP